MQNDQAKIDARIQELKDRSAAERLAPPAAMDGDKDQKPVFEIPDGPKSYIPDHLRELVEMGAAGKLWTLECEYVIDSEWKILRWRNLTDKECMERRLKMFQVGLTIPVHGEPGFWRIICPTDLKRVFLHRQTGYFKG